MKLMMIDGVNLNFTGIREKDVYGAGSYDDLQAYVRAYADEKGVMLDQYQSNHEGEIVDLLQKAYLEQYDGVAINPGAYTHYSYAIHDAIRGCGLPVVEVHMSNIQNREEFRSHSVTAPACAGQIAGFGWYTYRMAIDALLEIVKK